MIDKFLHFTDPHIMGTTPESRSDEYPVAIYRKFKYMILFSKTNKINKWLCSGDLLNSPMIDDETFNPFLDLFDEAYKDFGLVIYSILGNHDIKYKNLDTYKHGKHYALNKHKWYKLFINHGGMYEFENTVVVGLDYKKEWECATNISIPFQVPDNKTLIVLTHNMLVGKHESKRINGRIVELSFKDFHVEPTPDLVLSGHYHPGFSKRTKMELENKVTYINPGSLGRTASNLANSDKSPAIIYIEVKGLKDFKTKWVKIPVNKNAFKEEYLEKYAENISTEKFLKAVSEFKNIKGNADKEIKDLLLSIPDHEKDFGITAKVDHETIDMILSKVEEIRKKRK